MAWVRGRPWRNIIVVAGIVMAVAVLGALGWRSYYRTFAGQIPSRIHYCGRDYDRGTTVSTIPSGDYTLVRVTTIGPAGRAVYAEQLVHQITMPAANLPCAMGLVVKQDNQYVRYGLSGGP